MAKNKSDSPRSWRRKPGGKSPRQARTGVGEDPMDGPYHSSSGKMKYLYLEGSPTFDLPSSFGETPQRQKGGQGIPKAERQKRHLPRKKGSPGPM